MANYLIILKTLVELDHSQSVNPRRAAGGYYHCRYFVNNSKTAETITMTTSVPYYAAI